MQVAENVVPAGVWSSDTTHSSIGFEVEHMGVSIFVARFTGFDAELVVGEGGVELRGSVHADSVDIQDEILRAHVLASDFLEADRYPELRFHSTSVEVNGDDLVVSGDLTIKDATRQIEARGALTPVVSDPTGNVRIGLTLQATIDRTDYGLDFQLPMPDGTPALGNDVALVVSLELVRGA
jgi:polyisoprenoid-binding protein YceI